MSLKLNIGAGDVAIDGFVPVDRKFGEEAYPLKYADNTVDEIRASHILEHFGHNEIPKVLDDWVRVLKPNGRIRIAVPDFDKIRSMAAEKSNDLWPLYLMGGQTDDSDYHKAVFTREMLENAMMHAGIEGIEEWQSRNTDCASLPVSLNLQGRKSPAGKPDPEQLVKVQAVMSVPRVGWNDSWSCIVEALHPFRIPVQQFNGVFWGQCMQRAFEQAMDAGIDWLLTIDFDSMFYSEHVDQLLGVMGSRPDVDAVCALQCRRGDVETPLMTIAGKNSADINGEPLKVDTAHFGLTMIRMEALKDIPKPWFISKCNQKGEWEEGRMDDDVWFWHQWKEHGKSVYVHPFCRIGHLQLMVTDFDEQMQSRHMHVKKWREMRAKQ